MVTPKVNETKRGSAHKAAGAGTPPSAQRRPPSRLRAERRSQPAPKGRHRAQPLNS